MAGRGRPDSVAPRRFDDVPTAPLVFGEHRTHDGERSDAVVVAALTTATITGSFMTTMAIPLQPHLPRLLDASSSDTAWVITITLLTSAILTPIAGKLGDMYGKRRLMLVLLALVFLGSVAIALSSMLWLVLLGRALQGAGLALVPLGVSILRDVLPVERLGASTGLVTASVGLGSSVAQPLSAFLADSIDWHAVFWGGAILSGLCFAFVVWAVPAHTRRTGGRFDLIGAGGLALGLTGILLAISRGNEWGWSSPATLIPLTGGVTTLLWWGWFELRRADPLVDLRVSSRPALLLTNIASIGMGFSMFAGNIVFPQLLQQSTDTGGLGLSLLNASLVMMPSGFFSVATSFSVGRLERRIGPKYFLLAGAVIVGSSYLTALLIHPDALQVGVINIVAATGAGLAFAAMPALILRTAPVTQTGSANGINALMRSLGTSTAAAALAAVLASSTIPGAPHGPSVPTAAPTAEAYAAAFLVIVFVALVSALLALAIPRTRPIADGVLINPDGII